MAIIKNPITVMAGGGGDVANGIIEEYKASTGTIDANTFVEVLNGANLCAASDTAVSNEVSYVSSIQAVLLDDDKVLVLHDSAVSSSGSDYLYGVICTFSGGKIMAGVDTKISNGPYSGASFSAVALDDSRVFIAYWGTDNYYSPNPYGMVCTISGTTITAGTEKQISSNGYMDYDNHAFSVVKLDSSKVFVAHSSYGIVCTISGTTITAGTDTKVFSSTIASVSATALDSSKVFIARTSGASSSSSLYGIVCTISGATITVGTDTSLSSTGYSGYHAKISAISLDSSRVFVAHNGGGETTAAKSRLYGVTCTISGTKITAGADTLLSSSTYGGDNSSAILVSDGRVFVVHGAYGANVIYGAFCAISGTTITPERSSGRSSAGASITLLSGIILQPSPFFAIKRDDRSIFVAHNGYASSAYRSYGCIYMETGGFVTPSENNNVISGLTKTECTTSTAGEVWVLNS